MKWARRVNPQRLVFVDEAGANIAMGWSQAWVRRGQELVEPRPTNWGPNLTMIGAIRQDPWGTLSTKWRAVTKVTFTVWVRQRLAPRTVRALRRVAQAARHVVTPHHCQQWFTHAGYVNSSTIREPVLAW